MTARRSIRRALTIPVTLVVAGAALTAISLPSAAAGSVTELMSVTPSGQGGNDSSGNALNDLDVSDDGRYVVFSSYADNLVTGDTNGTHDVFVHDRQAGTTSLVSLDSSGALGSAYSYAPQISGDGRWVTFTAIGSLDPDDNVGQVDVYLRDLVAGTTTLARLGPGDTTLVGNQRNIDLSADGRFVLFSSDDPALTGNPHPNEGLFVHDRTTGTTARMDVSSAGVPANGPASNPHISANGRFVSYGSTATNLVPDDEPTCTQIPYEEPDPHHPTPPQPVAVNCSDVFVHDRDPSASGSYDVGATTTMVSVDNAGNQGTNESGGGAVSDSGDVAFWSYADLDGGGGHEGEGDIFVRTHAGQTVQVGQGVSNLPIITPDGRYVLFDSYRTQGDPSDTNDRTDTFIYDRTTGGAERVSVGSGGAQLAAGGVNPAVTADGRYVAFVSLDTSVLPAGSTPDVANVFLHDRFGSANAAPLAQNSARSVRSNMTSGLTLSASDPDGDPLTYTVTSGPSHGTLGGTAPDLTYTPAPAYTGQDSLSYVVEDGHGGSATATVSITVGSTTSVSQSAAAGQTVASGTDPTPDQPNQVGVTTPVPGTITITQDDSAPDPAGYGVIGAQYQIEAPAASVTEPLRLDFAVSAAALPSGENLNTLAISRNGTPIAPCADNTGHANPDPCIASRAQAGDTITISVLSSHASSWSVLVPVRATALTAAPALLQIKPGLVKVTVAVVSARLTASGGALPGRLITFSANNGLALCQATTRADGTATCTTSVAGELAVVAGGGYRASFAGTPYLAPSSSRAGLIKIG